MKTVTLQFEGLDVAIAATIARMRDSGLPCVEITTRGRLMPSRISLRRWHLLSSVPPGMEDVFIAIVREQDIPMVKLCSTVLVTEYDRESA